MKIQYIGGITKKGGHCQFGDLGEGLAKKWC